MATRGKDRAVHSCRMFETPFIEWFSHIHPITPFLFWIPTGVGLSAYAMHRGLPPLHFFGIFLSGALAWTFAEYLLHRYVFHFVGPESWKRRFFFVFHGVHHDYPQDVERLVMPLGVSIPLGLAFYLAMSAAFETRVALALFAGFSLGYLAYDGVHYFTHHLKARSRLGKFLKRYHLVHHHTGVDGLYGVSSPLWDYLFRTASDRRNGA